MSSSEVDAHESGADARSVLDQDPMAYGDNGRSSFDGLS